MILNICPRCSTFESKRWYKISEEPAKICYRCYKKRGREKYKIRNALYKANWYKTRMHGTQKQKEIKSSPEYKFSQLKSNAKRRKKKQGGIGFNIAFDEFLRFWKKPCHYCGEIAESIDRLDSDGPYAINNIVPCCAFCNYLKSDLLTEGEMKSALEALSNFRQTGEIKIIKYPLYHPRAKRDRSNNRYTKLKHSAISRNIELLITEVEYFKFIAGKCCHYCMASLPTNGSGLDRIDHNVGYRLDNVIPCCPTCNDIRSDKLTVDETRAVISGVQEWRMNNS